MKFRGRGGLFRKSIHLEKKRVFFVKKAQLGGAVSTLAIQFIWLHFVKPQTCAITWFWTFLHPEVGIVTRFQEAPKILKQLVKINYSKKG